jgi:hypothetical protein
MSSADQRPLSLFSILSACVAALAGGALSLLSSRGQTPYWQDRDFWIISISGHCVLVAITLVAFGQQKLNLNTAKGLFNMFTLGLIGTLSVVTLFVLGAYPPLGLIFSGRALLTSFAAVTVFAVLRTFNGGEPE